MGRVGSRLLAQRGRAQPSVRGGSPAEQGSSSSSQPHWQRHAAARIPLPNRRRRLTMRHEQGAHSCVQHRLQLAVQQAARQQAAQDAALRQKVHVLARGRGKEGRGRGGGRWGRAGEAAKQAQLQQARRARQEASQTGWARGGLAQHSTCMRCAMGQAPAAAPHRPAHAGPHGCDDLQGGDGRARASLATLAHLEMTTEHPAGPGAVHGNLAGTQPAGRHNRRPCGAPAPHPRAGPPGGWRRAQRCRRGPGRL